MVVVLVIVVVVGGGGRIVGGGVDGSPILVVVAAVPIRAMIIFEVVLGMLVSSSRSRHIRRSNHRSR